MKCMSNFQKCYFLDFLVMNPEYKKHQHLQIVRIIQKNNIDFTENRNGIFLNMKDLNKILYDILLKIKPNFKERNTVNFNQLIFTKYFDELNGHDNIKYIEMKNYFSNFYNYCSKLSLDNILKEVINFKNYGSS